MSKVFLYSAALSSSVGVVNGLIMADMMKYPGYDGPLDVTGSFSLQENGITLALNGLEMSTMGGVHIHEGMQCESPGPHRWKNKTAVDPWLVAQWSSDAAGASTSDLTVDSGYTEAENDMRAVVIHASNGDKIACGVLSRAPCEAFCAYNADVCKDNDLFADCATKCAMLAPGSTGDARKGEDSRSCRLYHTWAASPEGLDDPVTHCAHASNMGGGACVDSAEMMKYPAYDGALNIMGKVQFVNTAAGESSVTVALSGLEADKMGGVHIHANMQCENPGPHFYTPNGADDPDEWTQTKWDSAANGEATNTVTVSSGYNRDANNMHAVVIHDSAGDKVACGVINMSPCEAFCKYNMDICNDGLKSYTDMSTCLSDCGDYAPGSTGDARKGEDSLSCRLYHTWAASDEGLDDPATHCPHAAKVSVPCTDPEPEPEPPSPEPVDGPASVALPNMGMAATAIGLASFLF